MIHGYHVILTMYGFWLPNDPRGSWSDFVGRWEIAKFGKPRTTIERRSLSELTPAEHSRRIAARKALIYPPVALNDEQISSIANGFAEVVRSNGYTIWACAVMPEHTHLVVARHIYKIEQIATLLKGAATRKIVIDKRHPMQHLHHQKPMPSMWAARCWKIYLDKEQSIENAIQYVVDNPIKEGKKKQSWSFVTPFRGLDVGNITYH